jgi:hypothetical protein
MKQQPPQFCDYDCPFADFPPAETAGICRTMAAVWCRRLKELVNKNGACEYRQRARRSAKTSSVPSRRSRRQTRRG